MDPFATIKDIEELWRELKKTEITRAEKLLEVVSDFFAYGSR